MKRPILTTSLFEKGLGPFPRRDIVNLGRLICYPILNGAAKNVIFLSVSQT